MTAADRGWIAIKPRRNRGIKLHLLSRTGADAPTLCGRYTFADALPESTPASYPECQVCVATAERRRANLTARTGLEPLPGREADELWVDYGDTADHYPPTEGV